ncbi:hypothetical protein HGRIS_000546 [Hohenbuehelia grisea]|uniref:CxC2-like cysteine cluster KDZ transposase-associated domain-containing protein n=1 Tax=Hohenbuehelia grisea TaxID=104357 RepID=A0ABR3JT97_9AGAR
MSSSRNSRSTRRTGLYTHQPITSSKVSIEPIPDALESAPQFQADDSSIRDEVHFDALSGISVKTKARRYLNSDAPLLTWMTYRDDYLDALITREGCRGQSTEQCPSCGVKPPKVRCDTCHDARFLCKECLIADHWDKPLHAICEWTNGYFARTSLPSLGICFQLGHSASERCSFASPSHKDFIVVDGNGIHPVAVDFCGCRDIPHYRQLLNIGWWPATPLEPQTCFTFAVLRLFHSLNLHGTLPATDFYRALDFMTDAHDLENVPDRLEAFMLVTHEWRHIRAAKRSGRGHDPTRISDTKEGDFAVLCRACPQPQLNLPEGWELSPAGKAWLYRLIVAPDANFKLKGRRRATDAAEVGLAPGFAYFVAEKAYREHLKNYATQAEISHCVGFAAIWQANSRKQKNLRASGVGALSCARHEIFRPTGTADLEGGEKYCSMDYTFLSGLKGTQARSIAVSYDIACQWFKNFWKRCEKMPPELRLLSKPVLEFFVPKFHLAAHIPECQAPFSFNFTPGVGRTDGEGVERNWAWLNRVAASISQMGPSARQEALDDIIGFMNFRKNMGLGKTLLRRLVLAMPKAVKHCQAFQEFTAGLQRKHAEEVLLWETMVQQWETDHANANPYMVESSALSLSLVKQRLAEQEHQDIQDGAVHPEGGPSGFIIEGLAIEEVQLSVRAEACRQNLTAPQATALQKQCTALLKRMLKHTSLRASFMPAFDGLLAKLPPRPDNTRLSENMPVYLPSSLQQPLRHRTCTDDLTSTEESLREAQAHEALEDVRRQLRTRTLAAHHGTRIARSQGAYTRTRAIHSQIESRLRSATLRYRNARSALLSLHGPGTWEQDLRVLHPADVRGINERELNETEQQEWEAARRFAGEDEDAAGASIPTAPVAVVEVGEGPRRLSWIWHNTGLSDADMDKDGPRHESVRVEWAKARARARGWGNEVEMLEEEMCRSIAFCQSRAAWWKTQATRRAVDDAQLRDGLSAYAHEQAATELKLALRWSAQWIDARCRAAAILADFDAAEKLPHITINIDLHDDNNNNNNIDGDGGAFDVDDPLSLG